MKKVLLLSIMLLVVIAFNPDDKPSGLNVGDQAPNFIALNQNSKKIELNEMLKSGSVVLLFYRGEWCPYCNRQLQAMEDSLSLVTAKGATIIAVSPEKLENITKTISKTKASFSFVSDENANIMKAYRVAFELDSATTVRYKSYGINLEDRNGTSGNNLPVPAVYIINKEGKITYRYFDVDYKKRASVIDIINHL